LVSLSSLGVTGTNNAQRQVSSTRWTDLLTGVGYGSAKDPRWYGAALDGTTDDSAAFDAQMAAVGHVAVPYGYTMRLKGGRILPSGSRVTGPGTINFDASATSWLFAPGADGSSVNVSDIRIEGLHITSSSDVGFMHIVRLSNTGTIDRFNFNNNVIEYTATPGNTNDRWVIAGSNHGGTRTNFQINGNRVVGPMQLLASAIGGHTIQHWQVCFNRLHNTRSNAIAIVTLGGITGANTAEDILIGWNDISADTYTSTGIFIGIDGVSTDLCVALRRIKVIGNRINITAAGKGQPDILIRLGNLCASIGGFDSVQDTIILEDNDTYGSVQVTQDMPSTASGTSTVGKFVFDNNRMYGGDLNLSYLADGALLKDNKGFGSSLRLNIGNGRVDSSHNIWRSFVPQSTSGEFTFNAYEDKFLGTGAAFETPFLLDPTTGKTQTANLNNCTIESASASPQSAIGTTGLGTATATVTNLHTTTSWATGRYTHAASAGGITDNTNAPNIQTVTSAATVTPTFLNDQVNITALATNLTLANPTTTGTAVPARPLVIRIKDNGTSRTISYGTQYRAMGVTLPTATTISKTVYLRMIYNSTDTKWDVITVAQEA
jgi:hypothetical protein